MYAALAANMDSLLCVRGKKTSPHSLRRRMGGSFIDRTVHWSVPLTFTDCRSDTNLLGESGKLWELPILKTALHADICSGIYQNVLVWLIIVSVFRLWGCFQKLLAVDTYSIPNGFLFRSCEPPSFLAHGTHSFPVSIMYNIFSPLSTDSVQFLLFHKRKSFSFVNMHICPSIGDIFSCSITLPAPPESPPGGR